MIIVGLLALFAGFGYGYFYIYLLKDEIINYNKDWGIIVALLFGGLLDIGLIIIGFYLTVAFFIGG